jgi:N-acetylneuraminic acid mutarotase
MNKASTHLLLASALTLLAGCFADSSSSSNTGSAQLSAPFEDSASSITSAIDSCWAPTASPSSYRVDHTMTLLPNGKVLVTGGGWRRFRDGQTEYINLATAEVYDSASGTWSATGSMSLPRLNHTATRLPDGKVLVAGGADGALGIALEVAEVYDPVSRTWSATGSMSSRREGHTATLLPNGKVLVSGGYNPSGYVAQSEVYDPASGTWSTAGSLSVARAGHTATLLPNGKVLVTAGYRIDPGYLASVEVYDPASDTWSAAGSLSSNRLDHTATLLPNGKVLVVGGNNSHVGAVATAEVYDPASGTWSMTGSMTRIRHSHTATLLPGGKVLVTGGSDFILGLKTAEVYDPASGTWSATGLMSQPRYDHTAALLPNGKVLVTGGFREYYAYDYVAEAELYACGVEVPSTCPDGSPLSVVNVSSGALTLSLQCAQELTLECGVRPWMDPGATAKDGESPLVVHKYNSGDDDGDGIPGARDPDDHGPGPNMSFEGSYSMQYVAWNNAGETVSATRTVHVQDTLKPVLKLKGPAQVTHVCGSEWVDPGVEASDTCSGDLTPLVEQTGYANGWVEGTYTLTYSVSDYGGNSAPPVTRTVEVIDCPW